ncbi:MAG: hypothetical protein ABIR66_12925 [Saprospiraceae bacterium]
MFKQDETFIAYAPWLEVVGQGGNKKEALDDLVQIVKITIDWDLENNTIHDLLLELGWTLKEKPKFSFRPPLFNKSSIKQK